MTEEQAKAIIKTITGVTVGEHPEALNIAVSISHALRDAVETLGGPGIKPLDT